MTSSIGPIIIGNSQWNIRETNIEKFSVQHAHIQHLKCEIKIIMNEYMVSSFETKGAYH